MGWFVFFGLLFLVAVVVPGVIERKREEEKIGAMATEERAKYLEIKALRIQEQQQIAKFGAVNVNLICPHCHTKSRVRFKSVKRVSTTTTVAILKSKAVTSYSDATQLHCEQCEVTWHV
jgi:hypothetical protein